MYVMGNVNVTKAHVTGFVVGVGVAATGYYVYMKNKSKVDEFLSGYGINMPEQDKEDIGKLTLEELMLKKEHLEDIIAEKEMEMNQQMSTVE